jgi:hypothetical protein
MGAFLDRCVGLTARNAYHTHRSTAQAHRMGSAG